MTGQQWADLHQHLDDDVERAGFLFLSTANESEWPVVEMWLLDRERHLVRSAQHLILDESIRPQVIRHAHVNGYAVAELHSHWSPGSWTRFSRYDVENLSEFAPHMIWRLPGRPYLALVFGQESFDGLVWLDRSRPHTLAALRVDSHEQIPTGLSAQMFTEREDEDG